MRPVFVLAFVASAAAAQGAVQLSGDLPCPPPAPGECRLAAVYSFRVFSLRLDAIAGGGGLDASYSGTVHFDSSDPAATLPSDYTFTPGDQGEHFFDAVLSTPGDQTITVTDVAGGLIPALVGVRVIGVTPIPALSTPAAVLLVLLLCASGIWVTQKATG